MDSMFVRKRCADLTSRLCPITTPKYQLIEEEMEGEPSWPPVCESSNAQINRYQRLDSEVPASDMKETDYIYPPDTDSESCKSQPSSPVKSTPYLALGDMSVDLGHTQPVISPITATGNVNRNNDCDINEENKPLLDVEEYADPAYLLGMKDDPS